MSQYILHMYNVRNVAAYACNIINFDAWGPVCWVTLTKAFSTHTHTHTHTLAASGAHDHQLSRRCSYQLSYRGSSTGWAESCIQIRKHLNLKQHLNYIHVHVHVYSTHRHLHKSKAFVFMLVMNSTKVLHPQHVSIMQVCTNISFNVRVREFLKVHALLKRI